VNKSELIEQLAQRSQINVVQAEEVVNLIYRKMRDTLVSGGRIEIRGFGSFVVKEYGYEGRNPKTGDPVHVKAKKLPFFKVSKELKERVDAGRERHSLRPEALEPGDEDEGELDTDESAE